MRLSTLRTSTRPAPMVGAASTSLDTRARQRGFPSPASSAMTTPSSVATTTVRASAPTPPESRRSVETRQRSLPLAASSRATVPSRAAANTDSPTGAGEKEKRSELPMRALHSTRTSCGRSSGASAAGFGPLEEPKKLNGLQPESPRAAASASASVVGLLIGLSSQRLQPHAHALLEAAVLLVRLLERELVGRPGFGRLVFCEQEVAAHCGVLRLVGFGGLRLEKLERFVVGLFIQQDGSESQTREILEVLRWRVVPDPLQLRLRSLEVVTVEVVARRDKRAHRRVKRARITLDQGSRRIAQGLGVVRLRGPRDGVVEHAR